jgi:hypothetical protein
LLLPDADDAGDDRAFSHLDCHSITQNEMVHFSKHIERCRFLSRMMDHEFFISSMYAADRLSVEQALADQCKRLVVSRRNNN